MPTTVQRKEIQFEVMQPEPDIYPLKALLVGSEVFITICAKTAELGNSSQAKQMAYESRKDQRIAMGEVGIETQGGAYPVLKGSADPVRTSDVKQAGAKELRYCRIFRLKPVL